jgi:hypothetical protein
MGNVLNVRQARVEEASFGNVEKSLAMTDEPVVVRSAVQLHRSKHPRVSGVLCMDQDPCDAGEVVMTQVGRFHGLPYGVALRARALQVGKRICTLVNGGIEFTQWGLTNDRNSVTAQAVLHIGDGRVIKETPIVEFVRRPMPTNAKPLTSLEFMERQAYATLIPEHECRERYHHADIIKQVEQILKGDVSRIPDVIKVDDDSEMQLRADRQGRVIEIDQAHVKIKCAHQRVFEYSAPRGWRVALREHEPVQRGTLMFRPFADDIDQLHADDLLIKHCSRMWEARYLLCVNGQQFVRMPACEQVAHRCPTCQKSRPVMAPTRVLRNGEWDYPDHEQRCVLCHNIMLPLVVGAKYALSSRAFVMSQKHVVRAMPTIADLELTRKLARHLALDGRTFQSEADRQAVEAPARAQA